MMQKERSIGSHAKIGGRREDEDFEEMVDVERESKQADVLSCV